MLAGSGRGEGLAETLIGPGSRRTKHQRARDWRAAMTHLLPRPCYFRLSRTPILPHAYAVVKREPGEYCRHHFSARQTAPHHLHRSPPGQPREGSPLLGPHPEHLWC